MYVLVSQAWRGKCGARTGASWPPIVPAVVYRPGPRLGHNCLAGILGNLTASPIKGIKTAVVSKPELRGTSSSHLFEVLETGFGGWRVGIQRSRLWPFGVRR